MPLAHTRAAAGTRAGAARTAYALRLCAFPPALRLYTSVSVQIDRIAADGLHGHVVCVMQPTATTLTDKANITLHESGTASSLPIHNDNNNRTYLRSGQANHSHTSDHTTRSELYQTCTNFVNYSLTTCTDEEGVRRTGDDVVRASWPVFVPSTYIPVAGAVSHWSEFAIVGERMSVTLLYAVAVGDSAATLVLVASKLARDAAREQSSAATAHGPCGDNDTVTNDVQHTGARVGDRVRVRVAYVLEPGQLGVPERRPAAMGRRNDAAADTRVSAHFPACVMQSCGSAPAWSHTLLLIMPCHCMPDTLLAALSNTTNYSNHNNNTYCSPLSESVMPRGSDSQSISPTASVMTEMEAVVSEVVGDAERGRYVVLTTVSAYAEARQRAVEQERLAKARQVADVRRRLAAVLGEEAVRGVAEEEEVEGCVGVAGKRPRVE